MNVKVCIPHHPSTPDRERLADWTRSAWLRWVGECRGWLLSYGSDDDLPDEPKGTDRFNHALAINNAVGSGDPDDILVIVQADTFPDPGDLGERVQLAREGQHTFPALYVKLLPGDTDRVLAEADSLEGGAFVASQRVTEEWAGATSWAGVVVIRRDQFEQAGGYDPRFDGWSADDVAFAAAVETLVGPHLRLGTVFHLDHKVDLAETYGRAGFPASRLLTNRYESLRGNREAMRALVDERR